MFKSLKQLHGMWDILIIKGLRWSDPTHVAYLLLEAIRRLALKDTELANAYVGTLRLKLLKIGEVILRNTRRIRFLLSSAYPHQRLFFHVAARLAPD